LAVVCGAGMSVRAVNRDMENRAEGMDWPPLNASRRELGISTPDAFGR